MASASLAAAATPVNGTSSPAPAEDEALYAQLLRLCDTVLAGKHASFQLPAPAVERLKAALLAVDAQVPEHPDSSLNSAINGSSFSTNHTQLQPPSSRPQFNDWRDLRAFAPPLSNGSAPVYAAKPVSASGLDPIFLEKSEVVIRAEGQLKRQRLDRDLQAQVDQRRHSSRDKDTGLEAPSPINIDAVLLRALEQVKPISGLRDVDTSDASSSFDENDYYSSQIQSAWSSEASTSKGSDRAAGAFTADFERLDGVSPQAVSSSTAPRPYHRKNPSMPDASSQLYPKDRSRNYTNGPEELYAVGDEDDEYTPPDAAAFDSFGYEATNTGMGQITPPEDDNSDYEPGEITDSNNVPTPQNQTQQPSPRVPVIRNHLTHIVAPQPNRVSPLATAKGPSYELELVNGRPEVVRKPAPQPKVAHSRASTASPSGNGVMSNSKKRRLKKRKREADFASRSKKRREKQAAVDTHALPVYDEPRIKDEPMSPPPFASLSNVAPYRQTQSQQRPINIDLSPPSYAPQVQYVSEPQGSKMLYEPIHSTSPTYVRLASPTTQRPLQRDNQDLRRVASLHYAQQIPSPQRRELSPLGPYRRISMAHDETSSRSSLRTLEDDRASRYALPEPSYNTRAHRSRSPPREQESREYYPARARSPALMPPPAAPPRRIIVDRDGNRYYAAEPAPAQSLRSSVAPPERMPPPAASYNQRGSQSGFSHEQAPPPPTNHYEMAESRVLSQPPPIRRQTLMEPYTPHGHGNGSKVQDYRPHQAEPTRYAEAPASPIYQPVRGYEQMPPTPSRQQAASVRAASPPTYAPSRTYSVRPEDPLQMQQPGSNYLRHASVAPVQYARQDAPPPPMRAVSVMPGNDYGVMQQQQQHPQYAQQQSSFSQASHGVRYVDQFGNEVFPREIREVRY